MIEIQAEDRIARQRRLAQTAKLTRRGILIGVVAAILIAFICMGTFRAGIAVSPTPKGLTEVREWLRGNLDSQSWTEVRYWPPREMVETYQSNLEAALDTHNDPRFRSKDTAEAVEKIKASKPSIVSRLKYRTKNAFGAETMVDAFFFHNDGKVAPLTDKIDAIWASRYANFFPE